ncbi:ABC transporter ATP-binding protein [Cryobacterium arcticum]|uniref:Sulfonate ABC transporter ATP-binding protein n=1 Tax=Cryobacterium arcticum TaxID=670052 RepID=A0A318A599_9MICO|nr:ABC transporter ATP-binding protein [Cryobacterium arcticum]PXA73231.1 sulfonate ABC transporter ATP-binding protein [Cryobacterium arcticum]
MTIGLSLYDVGRTFGTTIAVQDVSLDIQPGEFVVLIGPSGCGKSTILRGLAGLDTEFDGRITAGGQAITGPSRERGVVFQEHRLLPWYNVAKNMMFGFDGSQAERKARLTEMLSLMHLEKFVDSYPHQLSGGMAQRTAIARALAPLPDVLLMDEPFGALDAFTRIEMQDALIDVWQKQRTTAVLVTHDIDEAIVLANRVVVMSAHPGTIKTVIDIDMEYPRNRTSERFSELRTLLLEQFLDSHHS